MNVFIKSYRSNVSGTAFVILFGLMGCESVDRDQNIHSGSQRNTLSTIAGNPLILGLAVIQNGIEIANLESSETILDPNAGSISLIATYQHPELIESEVSFIEGTDNPEGGRIARKIVPPEFFGQVLQSIPYIRFGIITTFTNGEVQEVTTAAWMKVNTLVIRALDESEFLGEEEGLVEEQTP